MAYSDLKLHSSKQTDSLLLHQRHLSWSCCNPGLTPNSIRHQQLQESTTMTGSEIKTILVTNCQSPKETEKVPKSHGELRVSCKLGCDNGLLKKANYSQLKKC